MRQLELPERLFIGLATAAFAWGLIEVMDAYSQVKIECVDPVEKTRIRELIIAGFDEGLKLKAADLYENWVRDETAQPKRAQVGLTNAINAYERAREGALKWNPPPC